MELELSVGRFSKQGNGTSNTARSTELGSLAVTQVEGDNVEVTRAGKRFIGGIQIIANGIAPVQAIPTTTATLALYNAESDGGKSLCIDRLHFFFLSGTAAIGATLMATVSPGKIATIPTGNATGYGSASSSGSSAITKARWATAVTLPSSPTAPAWTPLLCTLQAGNAALGSGDGVSIQDGGMVIPPGYCLGLAILSGAGTTPLYGIGCQWVELELDLE